MNYIEKFLLEIERDRRKGHGMPSRARFEQIHKQAQMITNTLKGGIISVAVLAAIIGMVHVDGDVININTDKNLPNSNENTSISAPVEIQGIDLENVTWTTNSDNIMSSDSVELLTKSIIKEMEEMYEKYPHNMPPVLVWQRLASLFYTENSCRPVDPKDDNYIGIGQMSVGATEDAIKRANKLYIDSMANGLDDDIDNYIVNNVVKLGSEQEIEEHAKKLWGISKMDPRMSGVLTALYLAHLSGTTASQYGENPDMIVMLYNVGQGNMAKFMSEGIVSLDEEKENTYIDLSKIGNLTLKQLNKLYEGVAYVVKVNGGYALIYEDMSSDIIQTLEVHRKNVNENINENVPKGVTINGYDKGVLDRDAMGR